MKPEFVAKPSNSRESICCNPCAPPIRDTNMKMPQKMPKAVSRLRVLFRVSVTNISSQTSQSNRLIFNLL